MGSSDKTILVVGGTGATGRLLVQCLLDLEVNVRVIVRSVDKIPATIRNHPRLLLTQASILELSDEEMAKQTAGCTGIASCLGHNLTWKGIYGHPRKLVTNAMQKICHSLTSNSSKSPVRIVLMNTTGNRNKDLREPISGAQKIVLAMLRKLLPPHVDNEHAAEFLRTQLSRNHTLAEWVVVRPDSLVDEQKESSYEVHPSPTRSAIFDPGKTSRINVAHFMAELLTNNYKWNAWKGQMPVIYNKEDI